MNILQYIKNIYLLCKFVILFIQELLFYKKIFLMTVTVREF